MSRVVLAATLAALVLPAMALSAPPAAKKAPRPDVDGDGTVSRSEAHAHAIQLFAIRDLNHDGRLDRADKQARRGAWFDHMDSNRDGVLSRAEYLAGGLDDARLPDPACRDTRPANGGEIAAIESIADTNRDGAIVQAEFVAAYIANFDKLDTDHDGKLNSRERLAARGRSGPVDPACASQTLPAQPASSVGR